VSAVTVAATIVVQHSNLAIGRRGTSKLRSQDLVLNYSLRLQIFTLLLASLLSLQSKQKEVEFCIVFVVVIAGGVLLTANVVLLGGSVSFFQAISLLGYCMFPLDIAAIVAVLVRCLLFTCVKNTF
jgi:Yip1 domain